ncbi:MAG TPA: M48 family metallopeptidase, partial [Aggregatilineales bacterium]|nr:M48 family metallopeptidase [Aggregatilineales bacterium]
MADSSFAVEPGADVALDPERQREARAYARIRRRLMLVDLLLGAAYLAVWLLAGWHLALRDFVVGISASPWINVPLFAFFFGLPLFLIDLPLSYYSGFVLPHRYGQSTQTLGEWVLDQIKGLALSGVLGVILLEVVYWLLRATPDLWWLYAGGVMLFFSVILSTLAPVLIAPLFYKFEPLDDEELVRRLKRLGERAGVEVEGVFRFDMSRRTRSANAAVMGLGRTRRIILGDTLLENFTDDEIETVLAHELAHVVHRDMPLGIVVNSALTLVSFWAVHLALRWAVGAYGLAGMADPAGLPVFALAVGVVGLIAMPLGNAFSRWRERRADAFALRVTGMPQAFAAAMTRLANQNLSEVAPEPWVVVLFYSHPPLAERIERARQMAG